MERADKVLVELGLCKSRAKAVDCIKQGLVTSHGQLVKKPSQLIDSNECTLEAGAEYVGRGALKIEAAIKEFEITCQGKIVADVGASTGGFTDYVLRSGAKEVFCIDVGHGQLAEKLLTDKRVHNFEGVNIRNGIDLGKKVDLCVVDLSFISLKLTFKEIWNLLKVEGEAIVLMKPQFEVGKKGLGKNGVVKTQQLRDDLLIEFDAFFSSCDVKEKRVIESPIVGRSGNREYLYYLKK
ncbi:MAG: TlyA family RNA methyltransferase [Bacteriovoracaceae bacterium]|jgi:23S rRNA (cytidine1920-2'-O)/16S rRNA (cytidine1409-2'-O)-methyltransferase|nr:TlyA family RNA methyltransferase [Bacteriovoracaceae bacterium]